MGVSEDELVLTNGSDELCYLIATLFIEPGAPVVLSDPCYQIDELVSRLHRGEPRFVPTASDGGHDLGPWPRRPPARPSSGCPLRTTRPGRG